MHKTAMVILAAGLAVPAMAQDRGRGSTRGDMMRRMQPPQGLAAVQDALDQVNLTKSQKAKIEQLTETLISQIKADLNEAQKKRLDAMLKKARFSAMVGDYALERVLLGLELTDEQIEKMKPVFAAHKKARDVYMAETAEKREELMNEFRQIRQDGGGREEMREVADKFRRIREGAPRRDSLVEKLMPALNEQQAAKLKRSMEQMNDWSNRRRGGGESRERTEQRQRERERSNSRQTPAPQGDL